MRKKLSLRTTEQEFSIIQQIAESEERSVSAQALVFLRFGLHQFQKEHIVSPVSLGAEDDQVEDNS